jgi:hypothetical protein
MAQVGKMTPPEGTPIIREHTYAYMHMSVDQQVTQMTDIYYATVTYETYYGQRTSSIETKSEYD